jgi:hypothetical protein
MNTVDRTREIEEKLFSRRTNLKIASLSVNHGNSIWSYFSVNEAKGNDMYVRLAAENGRENVIRDIRQLILV